MSGWAVIGIFAFAMLFMFKLLSWVLNKVNVRMQNSIEEYYKKRLKEKDAF
jgi:hypothetical protein